MAEAKAHNRSFSEEVLLRLGGSLEIDAQFGDYETYGLALLLGDVAKRISSISGRAWHDNAWTFEQFYQALTALVLYFEPMGSADYPRENGPKGTIICDGVTEELVGAAAASIQARIAAPMALSALEQSLRNPNMPGAEQLRPIAAMLMAKAFASADGVDPRIPDLLKAFRNDK